MEAPFLQIIIHKKAKRLFLRVNDTSPVEAAKATPFIVSSDISWENLGGGVERKILGCGNHLIMVLVRFEKCATSSLHHHVHRQVSYVESGSFEVTINGQPQVLKQGDSFLVAPDLVHGVVALEAGCLVDVFSPAREGFL